MYSLGWSVIIKSTINKSMEFWGLIDDSISFELINKRAKARKQIIWIILWFSKIRNNLCKITHTNTDTIMKKNIENFSRHKLYSVYQLNFHSKGSACYFSTQKAIWMSIAWFSVAEVRSNQIHWNSAQSTSHYNRYNF